MNRNQWIEKCNHWKSKWPVITEEYKANNVDGVLDIYAVLDALNQYSNNDDVFMADAGSASYTAPVALKSKNEQRFIFSPAQGDMGWALPASIGVSLSSNKQVISVNGDGSFMSNIQELAVIRKHDLNIKLVILNNDGYLSIKNTQTKYYQGRVYGTNEDTGLWFPNFSLVAATFGLHYECMSTKDDLVKFKEILSTPYPYIIDCRCKSQQEILPAQALKNGKQAGLHDMTPFLDVNELENELVVKELLNI
jgi:acetolactate synthase-1/2/3 large subunit